MTQKRLEWWRFLAPRYWPIWVALAVMRSIVPLPYAWQCALGRGIGRLVGRLASRRRRVAAINLAMCFPDLDDAARADLVGRHFESIGVSLVDMAICWWGSDRRLRAICQVEGLDHLKSAEAEGHGVLLYVGHFTSLELVARLLSLHIPEIRFIFRRHNNPLIDAVQYAAHLRHVEEVIPNSDTRAMIKALRAGRTLYYLPDQDYHGKLSAFVSFFGHQASTTTATTQLAKRTGASVVPMMPLRLPDDAGYRLIFHPRLEPFPGLDEVADTQLMMNILESQIRLAPEQYLWVHRRFKSRPEGESSPYL
ncbi:MAG: LpxL/LpxP family Kdo(2)-lipid IV(A) lauroyl/palmitoleoyl acyltransferase [Gammaproteobacteria bacterium]|nr:LpxL/LpxP family Kdo(2)-lipid IV(A) lauroyl/palmitoleoyl acyltransferase [Gammaproteobacteria bacterium]